VTLADCKPGQLVIMKLTKELYVIVSLMPETGLVCIRRSTSGASKGFPVEPHELMAAG